MDETVDEILEHFGIKGMRWGVRRDRSSSSSTGGKSAPRGKPTSVDAARVDKINRKVKTRGVASLSNAELKALNDRINLEQSYSRLTASKSNIAKMQKGHEAVKQILGVGTTALVAYNLAKSPMAKDIGKMLMKKSTG